MVLVMNDEIFARRWQGRSTGGRPWSRYDRSSRGKLCRMCGGSPGCLPGFRRTGTPGAEMKNRFGTRWMENSLPEMSVDVQMEASFGQLGKHVWNSGAMPGLQEKIWRLQMVLEAIGPQLSLCCKKTEKRSALLKTSKEWVLVILAP